MIYLDNASTTFPKPPQVLAAMQTFMTECGVSPGRGGYAAARAADALVARVRRKLTGLIGGDDPARMVFAASCTDALNLAIHGVLRDGDHVVTTALEHNSVSRPLETLRARGCITLTRVGCGADGRIDPDDIAAAINPRTRLITLNHASNVTGAIQPVAAVGAIAAESEAYFLLDAAQTMGVLDIAMADWHVDLLAFPAHKELLGPPGVGGLYVGPRVAIDAYRQGGTGSDSIHPTQPDDWPFRLEAGTPNVVGLAGLDAALATIDPPATRARLQALTGRLTQALAALPAVRVRGMLDAADCVGVCALTLEGMAAEDVGAILDESYDIAARAGLHCAPYAHRALGTFPNGALRLSPGVYTTEAEIDQTVTAIAQLSDSAL
jgi:cysteine desulfurase/selenocysteine lyase